MMFLTRTCIWLMLGLAAVIAIACAGEEQSAAPAPATEQPAPGLLNVVATVSPITSIVENIGGTASPWKVWCRKA